MVSSTATPFGPDSKITTHGYHPCFIFKRRATRFISSSKLLLNALTSLTFDRGRALRFVRRAFFPFAASTTAVDCNCEVVLRIFSYPRRVSLRLSLCRSWMKRHICSREVLCRANNKSPSASSLNARVGPAYSLPFIFTTIRHLSLPCCLTPPSSERNFLGGAIKEVRSRCEAVKMLKYKKLRIFCLRYADCCLGVSFFRGPIHWPPKMALLGLKCERCKNSTFIGNLCLFYRIK